MRMQINQAAGKGDGVSFSDFKSYSVISLARVKTWFNKRDLKHFTKGKPLYTHLKFVVYRLRCYVKLLTLLQELGSTYKSRSGLLLFRRIEKVRVTSLLTLQDRLHCGKNLLLECLLVQSVHLWDPLPISSWYSCFFLKEFIPLGTYASRWKKAPRTASWLQTRFRWPYSHYQR